MVHVRQRRRRFQLHLQLGEFVAQLFRIRQKLMQRRIEQANRHRQPRHLAKDSDEVTTLQRQQLFERLFARTDTFGKDHLAHRCEALIAKEHMLSAAKSDSFSAKTACRLCVERRVGICAHTQTTEMIGPRHELVKIVTERRLNRRHLAEEHTSSRAIDGDPFAFRDHSTIDGELLLTVINIQSLRATHTSFAHTTRNHCGVTRHTAARRDYRLRCNHAVEIIGTRFESHQHYACTLARHLFCLVRTKHNLTLRSARTCRQTRREYCRVRLWIDSRVQKLIELFGRHTFHCRRFVDQFFVNHVDCDAHGRSAAAFTGSRLQHPKLAALDREFTVLHVAVVGFEQARDLRELIVNLGQFFFQLRDRIRSSNAGDNVFTLRVQ